MAVSFLIGDLFLSDAQTLAHGCNCRGRMGAGVALELRRRYPEVFREYRRRCATGEFTPGGYYLEKTTRPWILNLATQDELAGATLEYVDRCLTALSEYHSTEGITSLAMPRIGAGLGGLKWRDVKSLIIETLDPLPIPVYVYEAYEAGLKAAE